MAFVISNVMVKKPTRGVSEARIVSYQSIFARVPSLHAPSGAGVEETFMRDPNTWTHSLLCHWHAGLSLSVGLLYQTNYSIVLPLRALQSSVASQVWECFLYYLVSHTPPVKCFRCIISKSCCRSLCSHVQVAIAASTLKSSSLKHRPQPDMSHLESVT